MYYGGQIGSQHFMSLSWLNYKYFFDPAKFAPKLFPELVEGVTSSKMGLKLSSQKKIYDPVYESGSLSSWDLAVFLQLKTIGSDPPLADLPPFQQGLRDFVAIPAFLHLYNWFLRYSISTQSLLFGFATLCYISTSREQRNIVKQCATFKSIHKRIHPLLENYLKDQIGKTDHDDPNMRAVHVCSGEWENYSDVDHQLSKFGIWQLCCHTAMVK